MCAGNNAGAGLVSPDEAWFYYFVQPKGGDRRPLGGPRSCGLLPLEGRPR